MSVAALASIIGPAIGGWITDQSSWRWVFYVNLPVGVLTLLVLGIWLPSAISARSTSYQGRSVVRRIDFTGALTAAVATVCLLLALTWVRAPSRGRASEHHRLHFWILRDNRSYFLSH